MLQGVTGCYRVLQGPPVYPLFPCTASLYSLVPFIPGCSVANRRVARAASDWLANSVRPAPVRARGLAGRGLIGARTSVRRDLIGRIPCVPTGVCCRGDWE